MCRYTTIKGGMNQPPYTPIDISEIRLLNIKNQIKIKTY